jgi:hypothetical protein
MSLPHGMEIRNWSEPELSRVGSKPAIDSIIVKAKQYLQIGVFVGDVNKRTCIATKSCQGKVNKVRRILPSQCQQLCDALQHQVVSV